MKQQLYGFSVEDKNGSGCRLISKSLWTTLDGVNDYLRDNRNATPDPNQKSVYIATDRHGNETRYYIEFLTVIK